MHTFWQDLRYGARMLRRSPGFTAVAVLSLALGIGVNTLIFSLLNAILLKPLPVEKSDKLMAVYTSSFRGDPHGGTSYPDYLDFRDKNQVFSGLAAHFSMPFNLSANGQTERILGAGITANYFSVLGVNAAMGRTFLPQEDGEPGPKAIAVISHGLWERRFGAAPNIPGKTVTVNGHPVTVVGVAPNGFTGTVRGFLLDIWIPITAYQVMPSWTKNSLTQRTERWLDLIGRLKPDTTFEQAHSAFNLLARQLYQTYPESWSNSRKQARSVTLFPANQAFILPDLRTPIVRFMALLTALAGCVLLIACANVANLLLGRAEERRREISLRLSLGATRLRLVRQLLTESLLLPILAGAAGLLLATCSTELLVGFKPPIRAPITIDPAVDSRVLVFTLVVSLMTIWVSSLVPALQASKADVILALKGGALIPSKWGWFGLRNAALILQIALSLVLLIGAGLFVRSLQRAQATELGFDRNNVLLLSMDLRLQGYTETKGRAFYQQVLSRIGAMPGVRSLSLAGTIPLDLGSFLDTVSLEGYSPSPGEEMGVRFNIVTQGYFQTLGIPIVRGRGFTEQDIEGSQRVAIINEALARRYWPGQDPVGKRMGVGKLRNSLNLEVIGIARNAQYKFLSEESMAFFYVPLSQSYEPRITVHIRTAGDPKAILSAVRHEVQGLDKDLPLFEIKTLKEHITGIALLPFTLGSTLLGVFGVLALFLAAIGIYGVMTHWVSLRTPEMGIRMALGAQRRDVLILVFRQSITTVLIGLTIGLSASLSLSRFVASQLYQLSPTDPATCAGMGVFLGAVALLACYIPARRAAKVDPMVALRCE